MPEKKNRMDHKAIWCAAIVILALLAELFSCRATAFSDTDYPPVSFGAGDFVLVSLEKADDATFVTRARNASFVLLPDTPIQARTLDFDLQKEEGDNTEPVLFFTGKSGGVEGRFSAALTQQKDGVYRAAGDFQDVRCIELYPTEREDSRISFLAMEANAFLEPSAFSVFRLIGWAFVFGGAPSLIHLIRTLRKKERPSILSVYLLLGGAVSLFAIISLSLFSTARRFGPPVIVLLLLGYSAAFFLLRLAASQKTLHRRAGMLFLLAGAAFALANAPLQMPDESIHFGRSYALAMGHFDFRGDFDYPDDVDRLYAAFPERLAHYTAAGEYPGAMAGMRSYLKAQDEPFVGTSKAFSNVQLILPYLPSALAIAVVRLFSGNALFALFAARLANVLIGALAASFAICRAARFRGALLTLCFFPLTLYSVASTSYDALMCASLFIVLGLLLSKRLSRSDMALLLAAFALIVMIKPLYLVLALLPLLFSQESLPEGYTKKVLFLGMAAVGLVLWGLSLLYAGLFAKGILPAPVLPGVDKAAQVRWIFLHPLRFVVVALVDAFRRNFHLLDAGLFGHLDLFAALTTILAPLSILTVAALSVEKRTLSGKHTAGLLALTALFFFAVSAAFYVVDSVLGSSTILGIQARYFIPMLLPVSILLTGFFSQFLRSKSAEKDAFSAAQWILFAVALVAAGEVFAGYYLV